MQFGASTLRRGDAGEAVEELQLRLAGFRGTVWDGDFGPGTELQVIAFQKDYMKDSRPDGIVGPQTYAALREFAEDYFIEFSKVACPCGACSGFGQERFKNEYRRSKPQIEAYHNYEYPGVHKAILHSYRALMFYAFTDLKTQAFLTSGYRCWINNEQKGRKSTNHMGKALDCDFALQTGEDKRDDMNRCEDVRGMMSEKANFQIGWTGRNRKSFEPASIAPTWIHMDVRSYQPMYLADHYFVSSIEELDGAFLQKELIA